MNRINEVLAIINADGTIASNNGGVLSVAHVAASGVYDITLAPGYVVARTESASQVTPEGILAASGMITCAISHTSNTVKKVTVLKEGAAGAASALTDNAFNLTIRRTRR